ncbi:DUF485 domain-containing protein [Bacillus sp. UNC41MFS5]|uniref:DUF485 domain-containing protein n=1 Tax=Bacillus sp. UNC41MFS5 TaxID=1449046 RepID=UPI00068C262E|nr:DUF485 domain-containing protein [Bacillus sp. UNC41MFS5]
MGVQFQEQKLHTQKLHEDSYTSLIQTNDFQTLLKQKKSFILPMVVFFGLFYFALPILAAYTKVLNYQAIGHMTWAWVYALLQFVLVWVCGFVYIKKSEKFDKLAAAILAKHKEELY